MPRKKLNISKILLEKKYLFEKKSCQTIADEFGCSAKTIHNKLIEYKITTRSPGKYKKLHISKDILIKKYIKERKSFRTIAKELGCGKTTIELYIKKYNISTRENYETRIGMKFSDAWKKKISKNHANVSGNKNPRWIDGRCKTLKREIRTSKNYKKWRLSVFERDEFKCCWCDSKKNIHADHIKPFSVVLTENKIKTVEQAQDCNELWDLNNGRTLCESCHKKTNTWGPKALVYNCD